MQYYTLKVINVKDETIDAATVSFKQPALKRIKYVAGQYLTLIFRINNRRYLRPYSFSSAPGIDQTLDITVKRTPGGIVSNHIIDKVKIGDLVEVMEPMGSFVMDENRITSDSRIVLWGAGSGVTPLLSLAKYALHHKIGQHVTLVYGNRNEDSVIFNEQLKELEYRYTDFFRVWHFHTRFNVLKNNGRVMEGRIDPKKILAIMNDEGTLSNSFHYICGPEGLKQSVKDVLNNLNVNTDHVFTEDFAIVRDPKEFENIKTRSILIRKDGVLSNVEVAKGKSILEACLDSSIELSYSCQTGSCLVCKARLLKGEITMIGLQKPPAELRPDEYLLCCSFPLNDAVEIDAC